MRLACGEVHVNEDKSLRHLLHSLGLLGSQIDTEQLRRVRSLPQALLPYLDEMVSEAE